MVESKRENGLRRALLPALAAVAALPTFCASEPLPLFADGKTSWRIVVPDGASRYMRYAADELAGTLRKISGAEFPIVEASARRGRHQPRFGRHRRV